MRCIPTVHIALSALLLTACSAKPAGPPPPPLPSTPQASSPPPAPPPPVPATLLDALLADYQAARLPLPPLDAVLVRFDSTWRTQAPDGSSRPLVHLGFLLPAKAAGARPTILVGTRLHTPDERAAITPVQPEPAAAEGITAEWRSTFAIDAALATGIQLHARGADALAERLVALGVGESVGHWADFFSQPAKLPPRRALAALIRAHGANELIEPGTDRAAIAAILRASLEIDRAVPLPDAGAGRTPDFGPFLRSLEKSLSKSTAPAGSIEALIDDLVEMTSPREGGDKKTSNPPYDRLAERGFEAVPALIAHLDDDRLTRSVKLGFNNFPTYHQRVSDVVSDLLQAIAGNELGKDWLRRQQGYGLERAPVVAWWDAARAKGEEAYLALHVLPKEPKAEWPNALQLTILARKYPAHLADIYTTILDRRPTMQSHPVVTAIAASGLPAAEKRRLLLRGAASPHLEHRRAALWELVRIDPEAFVTTLVKTLDGLPRTPKEPYWRSREGAFANVVMETDDARAWEALLRTARRVDVGLRMELLNPMNYTYVGERRRALRLRFLAAFLDDTASRDRSQTPEMWSGPSAAFTFPVIRVCDFAAMKAASILGLKAEPLPSWTLAQWDELRANVRRELARSQTGAP